jgi:hypothetical protein
LIDQEDLKMGRNVGVDRLTAEVRAWVSEDIDEVILRLAARAGLRKGPYVRQVLISHVHTETLREQAARSSAATVLD